MLIYRAIGCKYLFGRCADAKGKISVVLIDDDMYWQGIMKEILDMESDIIVAGTAANREETLKLAQTVKFDVVLMDIGLSENLQDGIQLAAEISQVVAAKIIIFSTVKSEDIVLDAFAAGAVRYVNKENYLDIPNTIRAIHRNMSTIDILLKDYVRLKEKEELELLTPVEKEIFNYMEEGYSQTQIAEKLYKSTNTIKKQIGSILGKLGVSSTKEAVRKVKMRGNVAYDLMKSMYDSFPWQ